MGSLLQLPSQPLAPLPSAFPSQVATPRAFRAPVAAGLADPRSGGRGLHLVDVENHLGGYLTPQRVARVLEMYARIAPVQPGDEVWVGLAPATAHSVGAAVPAQYGLVVGVEGADSADRALSDIVRRIGVAERFARVCIGSGDGHFAATAALCVAQGVRTYAVTGEGALSAQLRLAVQHVVPLPMRACRELLHARRA